jgi:hypothetical protein
MVELDLILSTRLMDRDILGEVKKYIEVPEAIIITGPRHQVKPL